MYGQADKHDYSENYQDATLGCAAISEFINTTPAKGIESVTPVKSPVRKKLCAQFEQAIAPKAQSLFGTQASELISTPVLRPDPGKETIIATIMVIGPLLSTTTQSRSISVATIGHRLPNLVLKFSDECIEQVHTLVAGQEVVIFNAPAAEVRAKVINVNFRNDTSILSETTKRPQHGDKTFVELFAGAGCLGSALASYGFRRNRFIRR